MRIFVVFLTFFIWSTSFTIGKATLEFGPPIYLTGIRMLFAGIILLAFLAIFRRKELRLKRHHLFPLAMLALSAVYLTNALEFWGLQYLTTAKACFIYSLSPFLAALFSYIQFKEKVTPKKVLGLIVGFIGFLPFLLSQAEGKTSVSGMSFFSWAEIALMGAVICSVYGWILLRKLVKDNEVTPMMANGSSMLLGGLFALIHSGFTETWAPTPVSNYMGFIQGVLLMILVSNLICYNLYGWLLRHFTATFLSFAGLMTPLFAAFFGWLVLGETVNVAFFFSVGIIAIGLWFVYSEELRLGYISKQPSASKATG